MSSSGSSSSSRERERERERERDACDVNRYHAEIASDHAYDYGRPYASTCSELQ